MLIVGDNLPLEKKNSPLLGVCIPTFNRAKALEATLIHLVAVCEPNDIPIYISDNCSPDNTQQVCADFQTKHKNIYYYRQKENIGPDDNFEYVLKMANSKYRWLMADMSFILELDTLLKDLNDEEYDVYIANAAYGRERFLPTEIVKYDNSIDLLSDIGWHLTWISSMIYNEALIKAFDFKRYKDSSFNQLALVFETTTNRRCNIKFNPNLLVGVVPMEKQSNWHYHVFDVFYRQLYNVLMSLPIYYPLPIKLECFQKHTRFCDLCSTHDHYVRYLQRKISKTDIRTHKFYIQQAKFNNYNVLYFLTLFSPSLLKVIPFLKSKLNIQYLKRKITKLGLCLRGNNTASKKK